VYPVGSVAGSVHKGVSVQPERENVPKPDEHVTTGVPE
jgi:hypothetical protein